MKVVLLAGGMGTRLAEYTETRPKPMVEVGGRPILWYLMKHYAHYGFSEFVLALGYKGDLIKRYFLDYHGLSQNVTVSLKNGIVTPYGGEHAEDWTVDLVDTGLETMTGGRLKRLEPMLKSGTFMLTYGDGLSDVDIGKLLAFHKAHGKIATVTAVRPPARFGGLVFDGDRVTEFTEKPQIGEGWINGGFMCFEPKIFSYIDGDSTVLEKNPLEGLARGGELMAYRHDRFWQCVDTVRDLKVLEGLHESQNPPWKLWT
jgi:glucose-1-phosphate cytidylyltransferase